ncbi:MAG TPA: hypothetical protein VGR51_04515 [Thermoplasmata archaeon]|jgi:hypothetical protein|nr:hypothetical protein [Thermoplasmata archaeon]
MDRDAIKNGAVRYGLLFLISVVLVAGFWFHGEFYQIGLVPLLVVGGFVTFLVILALRALSPGGVRRRAHGVLRLPRESAERIAAGTQTLAILSIEDEPPVQGAVARTVVAATGQVVGVVRVRDVRRRLAADLHEEELAAAGFDDMEEFRSAWSRGRAWNPREIVTLVEVRREAGA